MKYPIGTQTFKKLIEEGMVYVDKTDLVYELAQKNICFLCRPRRFGKSLLISTLESYFKGEKELFKGLKIETEGLEKDWVKYPVLHLDFSNGNYQDTDGLKKFIDDSLDYWEMQYGKTTATEQRGKRFLYLIKKAHEKTGQKVVVLIDEYDKPLLDVLMEPMEQENRLVLKEFYGTFKAADEHLRFVLLTGVTKFSQVSVFSGFNQPDDISMDPEFDALCGLTKNEIKKYFNDEIGVMARKMKVRKTEMYEIIRKYYDGYHFSKGMTDIFNPFSVLNALMKRDIDDYWFGSGTPTYLVKLIDRNKTNIQKILDRQYESRYFMDYKADIEDPLAMIYQSGYLTIKGYNKDRRQYRLGFPNNEVQKGFVSLLANDYFHTDDDHNSPIIDINDALKQCRLDDLRDILTAYFATIPYDANYQQRDWSYESHYHYTLFLLFNMLSCYTVLTEKQNSRGRADIIVETPDYVYIFELKLDGTAAEALKQIDEKGYAEPYTADKRKLFKIGIAFSSEKKNIVEFEVAR